MSDQRKQHSLRTVRAGPSDYPDMAEYLVEIGIDSISLNPDTVVDTTGRILDLERSPRQLASHTESRQPQPCRGY
jgi:hypothetical protein